MKMRNIKYALFAVAAMMLASIQTSARNIEILGITNDGQQAQIKAKVDFDGSVPVAVTSYSYSMADGYTVTNTKHEFVNDGDNTYLTVDAFYFPDNDSYRYRVEVTFADGTREITPVFDENLSEQFMWLGDYQYIKGASGWDAQHPPVVDREIDSSLQFLLGGVHYYKGVDNHAPGYIVYDFGSPKFSRFVTRYGVQDDRTDGDVLFKFYTGNDPSKTDEGQMTLRESKAMYSLSNPARNNAPCVADLDLDMTGCSVLRVSYDQIDNNWGDHGHLAMARLYLPDVEKPTKQPQKVTFGNASSTLTEPVKLTATSTSGGKIFYRIISGSNLAVLNDNVLTPQWGGKGSVVVEATQYGDDQYFPAADYITFQVDAQPDYSILGVYRPSVENENGTAYIYALVDTKGKNLDMLDATVYSDPRKLTKIGTLSLLNDFDVNKGVNIIEFPINNYDNQVVQLSYKYSGSAEPDTIAYWNKEGSFDYVSDLPFSYGMGYGTFPGRDNTFNKMNNNVLAIGSNDNYYVRGFGLNASGYIEVSADKLAPYNRVILDIGAQYPETSKTQKLEFQLLNGNLTLANTGDVFKPGLTKWDFNFNNQQRLRIIANQGSDGNGNDYVCIGAPRLYFTGQEKSAQTISWDSNRRIVDRKSVNIPLSAVSSNENPVWYHIVKGGQYATIENNTTLVVHTFPEGGEEIVVDAYQPGDRIWAPSEVSTCSFQIVRGLEVQKNEYVELSESDVFDEMIIHADNRSSGQVNVKSGLLKVNKLVLKYTFIPNEWSYIAFPDNADIDKISNLGELGYNFNAYSGPAYRIRELDTQLRALDPESGGWKDLETPRVEGMKGYIMTVDNSLTDEPVEVTFNIDNTKVNLTELTQALSLTVDFSNSEPGSKQLLTVKSANPDIKSNSLTVEVTFSPSDTSTLPINHAKALDNTRYIFVNGHKAIRLTLPDQSPAKVVLFDKSGKNVVKAVRYIAPNVIDLSDVKSGKYNMMVQYGSAAKIFEIAL